MVRMNREQELHQRMVEIYTEAGRETGHWGNYYLRAVRSKGGLAAAKNILKQQPAGKIAKGFQALVDADRTDLSVEAVVLAPRFRPLFTQAEIVEAQRRLSGLPPVPQHKVPPERNFSGEIDDDVEVVEGSRRQVMVNAYERNPRARKACLAKHGYRCSVCDMSFAERYGEIGRHFIHVHHKKPLAARRKAYKLQPTVDLVPVCPNCHAMLHTQDPPLRVDVLRALLAKRERSTSTGG
jgi:5-methylcytosine-specific restriction protein A